MPNARVNGPTTIELLAPAGDLACMEAAVENGADAIYFGLDRGFNARVRATNISIDNVVDVMARLRRRRVKGYVTLNTLVFSDELAEFEKVVRQLARADVDAVLVQDLGAARLIRQVCPQLAIHASTQMTLTSSECIAAVKELGIERVVLPRELSIDEIAAVAKQSDVPVEVFAHGALCVAYSGQCLTSESLGGRSANRGHCAQACRLPYRVYRDGEHVELGRQKYLLSPQDLAAHSLVPELIDAGVASLKIEGRLKSPEYVASITANYRHVIDAAVRGERVKLTEQQSEEMELTFSRGLATGWLQSTDHKRLIPAVSSAKRGLLIGTVEAVRGSRVSVRLCRRVQAGDGVMFDCGRVQNDQPGGRIFEIWRKGQKTKGYVSDQVVDLAFRHGTPWIKDLQPGQDVWKTDDPKVTKRLRKTFEGEDARRRIGVAVHVRACVGRPIHVSATLPGLRPVSVSSDEPLEAARRYPASEQMFREQLGRLGHTPFSLDQLDCEIDGAPMVPLSVLGQIRRVLIDRLFERLDVPPKRQVATASVLESLKPKRAELRTRRVAEIDSAYDGRLRPSKLPYDGRPRPSQQDSTDGDVHRTEECLSTAHSRVDRTVNLHVLCRSELQLQAVLRSGVAHVSADFADIRQYRSAIQTARAANARLAVATPRIFKPGEAGVLSAIAHYQPDAVLVRNLAALRYFGKCRIPMVADYSLNVANQITADFIKQLGVERLTASYDLNRDQLMQLVAATPTEWLEVVVHQHMPMFHMEHCVFCAVLSPGTNKTNCGRPCDHHVVHLEDRVGMHHLLTADVGCRNTLYNAQPQSAAEAVPALIAAGVRWIRIELLEESTAPAIQETVSLYQQLLDGTCSGKEVWSRLRAANRVGVTRGTFEAKRDPLAIL